MGRLKTRFDALEALYGIAWELAVSEATLADPVDDPEWSWQEQNDLSLRLREIADLLRITGRDGA